MNSVEILNGVHQLGEYIQQGKKDEAERLTAKLVGDGVRLKLKSSQPQNDETSLSYVNIHTDCCGEYLSLFYNIEFKFILREVVQIRQGKYRATI